VIAGALAAASLSIVLGPPPPAPAYQYVGLAVSLLLAIACAVLVITRPASRGIFRLIMLGALIDVVLLALSGARLLA
jgi:hypothetical protein